MKIAFHITAAEAKRAEAFFKKFSHHQFVKTRRKRNVESKHPHPTKEIFWKALVSALLTTQQRSSPGSPISRLLQARPFPLGLRLCSSRRNLAGSIEKVIKSFGGIRRGPTIARELSANLAWLQAGAWINLMEQLETLDGHPSVEIERNVARYLADNLKGIGPKQGRNILQMLGLSRWETPLDSRVIKWLNSFGFPLHLSGASLSDPSYYEFVSDGFQALCQKAGVMPCVMDAAIFASFDQ